MNGYKFINKKNLKTKDGSDCYLVNIIKDEEDIIQIWTDKKCYDSLVFKFGEIIPSSKITSNSYVDKYGRLITTIKLA